MNKEKKNKIVGMNIGISAMTLICFVIYTVLVKTLDVRAVGADGSVVGFADLNEKIYNMLPFNEVLYKISEILGLVAFLIVAFFGFIGLMQLIRGKSLAKVDFKLYVLAGLYVVTGIVYVLFEKVIINYRPIIIDASEGLEASYPSSHTILGMVICLSAFVLYQHFIKDEKIVTIAKIATIVLMFGIVITRLLSGVHWITDIVGGLLISTALFSMFVTVINIVGTQSHSKKH